MKLGIRNVCMDTYVNNDYSLMTIDYTMIKVGLGLPTRISTRVKNFSTERYNLNKMLFQ